MRFQLFLILVFAASEPVIAQSDCSKKGKEIESRIDARVVAEEATPEQIREADGMKQMLNMQLPTFCAMGMDTSFLEAQIDEALDETFPPRTDEERTRDRAMAKLSKDDLTDAYLRGQWCSRPGEDGRGEGAWNTYEFSAGGSFKKGSPGLFYPERYKGRLSAAEVRTIEKGFEYGSKSDFLNGFEQLRSLEQGLFSLRIMVGRIQRFASFEKGKCPSPL